MILPNSTSAKILVDQDSYDKLIAAARAVIAKTQTHPDTMPWPFINELEQAVERATDPRLWTSEKDKVY